MFLFTISAKYSRLSDEVTLTRTYMYHKKDGFDNEKKLDKAAQLVSFVDVIFFLVFNPCKYIVL